MNALSERLVVWTKHDDLTYRAAFKRGGLVSLLSVCAGDDALGTNRLTFKPDASLVPGVLTFDDTEAIASRVANDGAQVPVSAIDRRAEQVSWV